MFEDLKKLNGILDVAIFDNQIIIMFNTRFYTFNEIDLKSGNITLNKKK
jgi:hypothetical protein